MRRLLSLYLGCRRVAESSLLLLSNTTSALIRDLNLFSQGWQSLALILPVQSLRLLMKESVRSAPRSSAKRFVTAFMDIVNLKGQVQKRNSNDMAVHTSEDVFEYYRYTPSVVACILFIVLFSITTTIHLYQLLRTRAWLLTPLVLGGYGECIGYILRIISSKQSPNYTLGIFIGQASPTLLAPALFTASIYMCLGRIILVIGGAHLSPIRLSWLTPFFVAGDVLGLAIQTAGATIMPRGTLEAYHNGSNIVIAGLAVLVFSFGIFLIVALTFDLRLRRAPTPRSLSTSLNWKSELKVLYISSALIFIRSIYRLAEYSEGNDGWLMRREWTYYVFDAALMWIVLVLFNVYHPSHAEALLKGGRYSKKLGAEIVEIKMESMEREEPQVAISRTFSLGFEFQRLIKSYLLPQPTPSNFLKPHTFGSTRPISCNSLKMTQQYANNQPAGFQNHIKNIAIVGAGGNLGSHIIASLLAKGEHTITILTRPESTSVFPTGITIKNIDYSSHSSLVSALHGQDALIITMAVAAPPDQEASLITAAAEAGVKWIMPNEWGQDFSNPALVKELLFLGPRLEKTRKLIEDLGVSSWLLVTCGFWYEYSLAGTEWRYGFDFKERTVTFYSDGMQKINTSTWPQIGRAAASLLSFKILPDDEDDTSEAILSRFKNKRCYMSSFLISQKDMWESVMRVTGTGESDWKIRDIASLNKVNGLHPAFWFHDIGYRVVTDRHQFHIMGIALSYFSGIAGFFWTAIHDVILNTVKLIPGSKNWVWPMIVEPHRSWHYAQELREKLGDTYMIISPAQIHIVSYNAEINAQVSARRNEFPKPTEIYEIVDMFGKSVLTTGGPEWRRHRKIVGPAFSEKSNILVWKESLKQGEGMLKFWSRQEGNVVGDMKVGNTSVDTTLMALYVVSSAGFGIRQVWEGEDEDQLGTKVVPGFNTSKLKPNHTLQFKDAINQLVHSVIWFALIPVWLLRKSPLNIHKKLVVCFDECADYFKELSEYKKEQFAKGEKADDGTMDVMGPLVKASENNPSESKGLYLTKQEVIANAWILLFAGHETSGSITHYSLLFLAVEQSTQAKLQADLDSIVGSRPVETWTYDTDLGLLYQSMVGAVINETLRLLPPIIDIPKIVRETPQTLNYEGRTITVPPNTMIQMGAVGVQRNPRYWPHSRSKISEKKHDLDDWIPERWFSGTKTNSPSESGEREDEETEDTPTSAAFTNPKTTHKLFTPTKGAYIPFAEGGRSCPGKRFAQIEITAVLAR
ncbi:hypothetical protein G7Y89_g14973 [Cudoniella acicularis]|uniref:NmrA-like domain-containing protein n=1 Tax=Cudoniella acicularis TaxID=354080 RepID=A0A8H4VRY4_9HELO|nr:hypothetical protein G7Y89_g14973 [Cudoniella acicularis]